MDSCESAEEKESQKLTHLVKSPLNRFRDNFGNFAWGLKTGGVLYFRIEAGYGLGSPPKSIDFTATANGVTESFSEPIPEIPGVNESGLLIGNIGIGFSF